MDYLGGPAVHKIHTQKQDPQNLLGLRRTCKSDGDKSVGDDFDDHLDENLLLGKSI